MAEHILVQDIVPRIQYTADGINKTFETPFIIFNEEALDVYLDEEKITQGYTIQTDDEMRGQVVFETAPENGTLITLSRHLTIARTSDFQEGGSLRANTLNYELDYQTACLQELADNINRSMVLPPYAVDSDIQLTLPLPKAGRAIVWDADGKNLENSELEMNKVYQQLTQNVSLAEQQAATATEQANLATEQALIATQKANAAAAAFESATVAADEAKACVTSKANTDMDNLTETGKANVFEQAVIVEKYCEGTEWYRIWSDGWIEQGGRGTMPATEATINLLKPFSNTNFCVTTATREHYAMTTKINSASQVEFDYPNTGTGDFYWYACGY